jgi:hypothetical protein
MQNGFVESFNGRLRDECLNEHLFSNLNEARQIIDEWRIDYNNRRTRASMGSHRPSLQPAPLRSYWTTLVRTFVAALGNREIKPSLVLGRRALELIDERPIDLLDVNPAVLHRLDGVGQLHQLARGGIRIGEGARFDEFHTAILYATSAAEPTADMNVTSAMGQRPTLGWASCQNPLARGLIRRTEYAAGWIAGHGAGAASPGRAQVVGDIGRRRGWLLTADAQRRGGDAFQSDSAPDDHIIQSNSVF